MCPIVSICIPTYNQVTFLKLTLESVLNQDFLDYEVIVSDDSTSDLVKEFIDSYFDRFKGKLKFFKNDRQLGSPDNMNEAIRRSSGKYIKILHHDDWFNYSFSLRVFVELMEKNPTATIGVVNARRVNIETFQTYSVHRPFLEWIKKVEKSPTHLIVGNMIGGPTSTIFKKPTFDNLFDPVFEWYVDLDAYIILLTRLGSEIALEPIEAVSIGRHDKQITRYCVDNRKMQLFELFHLLNKWNIDDLFQDIEMLEKVYKVLYRFRVKSEHEIYEAGYQGQLPRHLDALIKYVQLT